VPFLKTRDSEYTLQRRVFGRREAVASLFALVFLLLMIYTAITLTQFARRRFCSASTIDFAWDLIEAFCPARNTREQPMT
jgi:uncharacterized membrane protein YoaT (DUF817 family)